MRGRTCQSLTSLSSGLAWMWVLAMQMSWRRPCAAASGLGGSNASSTTISATLSCAQGYLLLPLMRSTILPQYGLGA